MIYLLDTNIISYLIKSRNLDMVDKFEEMSKFATICVSSITVAELFYGVKKKKSKKLEINVREFLYPVEKMPFDENSALIYGEVRVKLEKKGEVIGAHDMLIASHALALGATLVTNNTREFERVEGLSVEDWL